MNMYMEIYDAATLIKENNIKVKVDQGLCNLILVTMGKAIDYTDFMSTMYKCAMEWDEYSGNRIFPIPSHVKEYTEMDIFFSTEYPNYEGEYGEARMRYLDHVIEWMGVRAENYDMSICGMEAEANI